MALPLLPGNFAMMFFIAIVAFGGFGGEGVFDHLAAVLFELGQDVGLQFAIRFGAGGAGSEGYGLSGVI